MPLLTLSVLVSGHAHAGALNPSYWAEGSTDSSGNYSPFSPQATLSGNSVLGYIPTDTNSPDNDVINYFRTSTAMAGSAYDGIYLGDLSGQSGLTATFSLYDSALDPGAPFLASDIVGETYPGEVGSNASIRLMFMGGYLPDGITPNEWWSNPGSVSVTSMNNGQAVTLSVAFDPSQWSNYNGQVGSTDAAEFQEALSGVTRLGLSFGSGYFFSDGFGFDTGGTAYLQLDAIDATPEPGTFAILAAGLSLIAAFACRKARC
jgi:hypothetical protein